jgi:hypothetical protein
MIDRGSSPPACPRRRYSPAKGRGVLRNGPCVDPYAPEIRQGREEEILLDERDPGSKKMWGGRPRSQPLMGDGRGRPFWNAVCDVNERGL